MGRKKKREHEEDRSKREEKSLKKRIESFFRACEKLEDVNSIRIYDKSGTGEKMLFVVDSKLSRQSGVSELIKNEFADSSCKIVYVRLPEKLKPETKFEYVVG